jgi:hypothetical protein
MVRLFMAEGYKSLTKTGIKLEKSLNAGDFPMEKGSD